MLMCRGKCGAFTRFEQCATRQAFLSCPPRHIENKSIFKSSPTIKHVQKSEAQQNCHVFVPKVVFSSSSLLGCGNEVTTDRHIAKQRSGAASTQHMT